MKYHITPKQAKQITEQQFYSMFKEIVPRDDWANYHHRKMDVGKMIDLLGKVSIVKNDVDNLWFVTLSDGSNYCDLELANALWDAVKDSQ